MPAPVSPVITFSPDANGSSASRIRTRFSIRRLRSKGVAVAVEEGHLGEQREQPAPVAEPDRGLAVRGRARRPRRRRRSLSPRCVLGRPSSRCGRRARGRAVRPAAARAASVARRTSPPSRRAPRPAPGRRSRGCTRWSRSSSRRSRRRTAGRRDPRRRPPSPARPSGRSRRSRRPTSLIATAAVPSTSTSSVGSSTTRRSPANARASPSSIPSGVIAERKPTRPKLTPITGTSVSQEPVQRPQHRPVAAEHDREVDVVGLDHLGVGCRRDLLDARPRPGDHLGISVGEHGDPADGLRRRRHRSSCRARPGVVPPGRLTRWRKSSRFPFGPGRPESTTPTASASQPRAASCDLSCHSRSRLARGDDAALADLAAAGLELRLHEHHRLPARCGQPERRRQRLRHRDERHVADDELRRERQLGQARGRSGARERSRADRRAGAGAAGRSRRRARSHAQRRAGAGRR